MLLSIYNKNSIWLIADRILKILLSIVFTFLSAKLLSKEDFGLYGFILSLISIFSVFGSLGIQELLTSYFLKNDSDYQLILENGFIIILVSVIISISSLFFYLILVEGDEYVIELIMLCSLTILIRPFEIIQFLLDAQLKSSIYIQKLNLISVLFLFLKILVLIFTKSLHSIILISVIESFFLILFHIIISKKIGLKLNLKSFNFSYCKLLIFKVIPFLVSAITVMLYIRIDILFIKQWLGLKELAYYTAATKLSEVWYIVPMAISTSYFSRLNSAFQNDQSIFVSDLERLFNLLFKIAFILCLIITIFSKNIITLFYGADYKNSIEILQIHIWSLIAVIFGVFSSKWYILNNMSYILVWRSTLGLIINIVLNLIFIPYFGIQAAAISTVVSYSMSDIFFDLFFQRTRPLFRIKLNAILNLFNFSF
jgi:O-antigen/teichoic acid export membrane protein